MVTRRTLSPADAGCAGGAGTVVALWFPAVSVALHAAKSSAPAASAPTTAVKKSFLILLSVSENKLSSVESKPLCVCACIASHKTLAGRKRRPRNHTKGDEKLYEVNVISCDFAGSSFFGRGRTDADPAPEKLYERAGSML